MVAVNDGGKAVNVPKGCRELGRHVFDLPARRELSLLAIDSVQNETKPLQVWDPLDQAALLVQRDNILHNKEKKKGRGRGGGQEQHATSATSPK